MSTVPGDRPTFRLDMRSEIVAPPSAAVLAAIAEVAGRPGEFRWREDPVERALERRVGEILGKQAAALFPTCTAANIAGLVALGARDRTLLMDESCHLMTNEMAGIAWLAGRQPRTFKGGVSLDIAAFRDERTAVLCLENTHNRRGGTVLGASETARAAEQARSVGWGVFLDGSRLWNAAVASGSAPSALAGPADLVSVSFNKGLSAPNGAALAGDEETVATAVEAWRSLGGICRPSHLLAAGALAALGEMDRLRDDHDLARETASAIAGLGHYAVSEPETNIVLVSSRDIGLTGATLAGALGKAGLGCLAFGPDRIRLVFHRGIPAGSAEEISAVFSAVARDLGAASAA